ncbi:MAG: aminodeoxychorismate synthase component I, partial [Myxococcales bacterium]|nr:aminodeoxychorismate synthase component I [Myxococcales bacterium]
RGPPPTAAPPPSAAAGDPRYRIHSRRLPHAIDAERAFVHLYGAEPHAFWLDSSLVRPGLSRFSFMGGGGGPHGQRLEHDAQTRTLTVTRGAQTTQHTQDLLDYLDHALAQRRCPCPELPFEFNGGFVGYLGYELRAELGGAVHHPSSLPDACLLLADRLLAFDHEAPAVYLVCLAAEGEHADAEAWLDATEARLRALPEPTPLDAKLPPPSSPSSPEPPVDALGFRLARSRAAYLHDIERCLGELRAGQSYELCLTNELATEARPDPLTLHRILRATNPAPFAAFLRFGDLAVACASPERFLRVDRGGRVEARPIKGTAPRGPTPERDTALREGLRESPKDRAENLMIVDLLRNDLGSVCAVGSVAVPRLMDVETYASVHQLVSTVVGQLAPGRPATDCVRAAFPGGSMTGAPKRRTMEILERLEARPRGVYSGAIGYFGLGGGLDLNIVIRTAVLTPRGVTIGAGGAIVTLSDPAQEFDEVLLKARPVMRAVAAALRPVDA